MNRRQFGWAKKDRGITEDSNHKQTGHASLFGWQTRPRASAPHNMFSSPANTRNMAEQKKQERDFTPEVDAIIPETTSLAQVSWVTCPIPFMFSPLFIYSLANFRKLLTNFLLSKNKQEM